MPNSAKNLLEDWKKKLLDLSKRNSLINFRSSKRGSLQIVYPDYQKLFNEVLNENKLYFPQPVVCESEDFEKECLKFDIRSTKEDIKEESAILHSLRRKARTITEEQGINVLHLTFGQLKWQEVGDKNIYSSPLILIPVTINLESALSPYVLELQDEDVTVNPTLRYKLEHDFNIRLPEFDIEEGISQYLKNCQKLIVEQKDWEVEPTVFLSTFSYLKINMYYDLCQNEESVCNNEIVKALAGDFSKLQDFGPVISEVENMDFDKDIQPKDVYQVLDADYSQQTAIELAKRGVSFVLQGPPGTGKSQTITNIIAECLAAGKKVLFVSEKEAALEVVRNRLVQTGIVDFCLSMHSHKANKKEIINELYHTACLDKKRFKEENLVQLKKLYENRNRLNELSDELHKEISPLHKSIYEVNGELSKLEGVTNVAFDIENVSKIDTPKLSEIIDNINLLTKSIECFGGEQFSILWNNCSLPGLSNQNKSDFFAKITPDIIDALTSIISLTEPILKEQSTLSWNNLNLLVDTLSFCAKGTPCPKNWKINKTDQLISLAKEWKTKWNEVQPSYSIVNEKYLTSIVEYPAKKVINEIDNLKHFITESTGFYLDSEKQDTYIPKVQTLAKISKEIASFIDSLFQSERNMSYLKLDIRNRDLTKFQDVVSILKVIESLDGINKNWFDHSSTNVIENLIQLTSDTLDQIEQRRSFILSGYDESIFTIDFENMLPKFRTKYKSAFRWLNSSYRKDMFAIRQIKKDGVLKYEDALKILNSLQELFDIECALENKSKDFEKYFGLPNVPCKCDLHNFSELCNKLNQVRSFYSNRIPESVKSFILDKKYKSDDFVEFTTKVSKASDREDSIVKDMFLFLPNEQSKVLTGIYSNALKLSEKSIKILDNFDSLSIYANKQLTNFGDISHINSWQQFWNELKFNDSKLISAFGTFYNGKDTDWDNIIDTISWLEQYNKYAQQLPLSSTFTLDTTTKQTAINDCQKIADELRKQIRSINKRFVWFDNWFSQESSILACDLKQAKEIVLFYCENIEYLDGWLRIQYFKNNCCSLGLSSFVEQVINDVSIPAKSYLGIFIKRFYAIWLDKYVNELPLLSKLSQIELTNLLNDFKIQDTDQFVYAKFRIYQILSEQLPNTSITGGATDQMGILRREYNKKRRQLPLRKLFNQIPTLVQKIKPCIMMSPLSVSLFLENRDYNFDVVIFDEASQVKPENAIGAIVRGAQVIIAGDAHQLPPTSFFEKNSIDDDWYDNKDSDLENFAVEESILEATANILPEKYLKWHYRSRHEHLIAFSNAKIYDNRLTTFPSVVNQQQDMGVELIYLPDGIYDRSGHRNNLREAQKVVELVVNHIRNHPDRSLGVIANSEAQARTIDELITKLRQNQPELETFFDENKIEPFFVKNLESVQGDERDSIFFSIGYGKDSNGKMYNSFGPINLEGGERRLNVAITRAKFNLKLITSIDSSEIAITEKSKQGPRLLKSYIDFAKRGMAAISEEIHDGNKVSFDSPFEESVYNYLLEKGYDVETQIGCAGYRIDLGVRDPNNPGRYLLGIECDGATYHSTKYARERDRLRQTVLENIGWKIHRIWSTEWIRQPVVAKNRLISIIQKANDSISPACSSKVIIKDDYQYKATNIIDESNLTEDVILENQDKQDLCGYDLIEYKVAHINEESDNLEKVRQIVSEESPIHKSILYKRMAPFLGREKVTSMVRSQVDSLLSLCDFHIENDFIYLKPKQKKYQIRQRADREIDTICPEELMDLFMQIAKSAVGITPENLILEVGHSLGYGHCKSKITSVLESVVSILLNSGLLKITPSGSVVVKDND